MATIETRSLEAMRDDLVLRGFTVGPRDTRLNTRYPGAFMVVEEYEDMGLPTEDGSNGPWCIVGDDIEAMIKEAWEIWHLEYTQDGDRR